MTSNGELKGIVSNIQVYSLNDGPGLRTLVFLKGCPLRCDWCCNPEGQKVNPEVEFYQARCIKCGSCSKACKQGAINPNLELKTGFKIDRQRCNHCGECVEACPSGALKLIGKAISVDEVLEEVKKDRYFYMTSHGGVTLSGGEPLYQLDFALELLKRLYDENIDTAIETCGCVPWRRFEKILPYLNLALFDIKHMNSMLHKEATGVANKLILSNLKKLAERGVQLVIRLPLIPGCNLDAENIRETGKFISSLPGVTQVDLMPFHQLGKDKYRRLSLEYAFKDCVSLESSQQGRDEIQEVVKVLESYKLKVRVGG